MCEDSSRGSRRLRARAPIAPIVTVAISVRWRSMITSSATMTAYSFPVNASAVALHGHACTNAIAAGACSATLIGARRAHRHCGALHPFGRRPRQRRPHASAQKPADGEAQSARVHRLPDRSDLQLSPLHTRPMRSTVSTGRCMRLDQPPRRTPMVMPNLRKHHWRRAKQPLSAASLYARQAIPGTQAATISRQPVDCRMIDHAS